MDCNTQPLMDATQPLTDGKRQKLRSAWISFAGRIAAQLIGAVATVGLGVVVFSNRMPTAAAQVTPASSQQDVLVARPVRTQHGTVIVLVPLNRYNEVTTETVERLSRVLATELSQTVNEDEAQLETPRWAAANAH
jgi:hypothetical protein